MAPATGAVNSATTRPGNRTISGHWPNGWEAWDVSSFSSATNKIQDSGWSYDAAGNVIGAHSAQASVSLLYDAENHPVVYRFSYTQNCTDSPARA